MYLINLALPKFMRVKNIFEPFIFLLLTISSIIGINISLAIHGFLTSEDIIITIFYFYNFIIVLLILNLSSQYLLTGKKLIKLFSLIRKNKNVRIYFGEQVWSNKRLFHLVYIFLILYLALSIMINVQIILQGFNHGNKINFINNNYFVKLISYYDSFVAGFLIFFILSFVFFSNLKLHKIPLIILIFLILIKYGTSLSRASFINLVSLLAPFSILYNYKKYNYLAVIVFPIVMLHAFFVSDFQDKTIFEKIASLITRVFLNSDFSLWFRYYSKIELTEFIEYDFTYYFYPFLSKIIKYDISAGLGPFIFSLYSKENFGNGPIPTFFYEAYILFKGNPIALFVHSTIYASIFFFNRYFSLLFMTRLKTFFRVVLFYYLYFISPSLFGDTFLFEAYTIFYISFIIVFYLCIIVFIKKRI